MADNSFALIPYVLKIWPLTLYFVSLIPPIDTKYMVLPTGDYANIECGFARRFAHWLLHFFHASNVLFTWRWISIIGSMAAPPSLFWIQVYLNPVYITLRNLTQKSTTRFRHSGRDKMASKTTNFFSTFRHLQALLRLSAIATWQRRYKNSKVSRF